MTRHARVRNDTPGAVFAGLTNPRHFQKGNAPPPARHRVSWVNEAMRATGNNKTANPRRATPTPEQVKRFGTIGCPVGGSGYVRDYCSQCADPIRVVSPGENLCQECLGSREEYRQTHGKAATMNDEASDGYLANSIRSMEER